MAVTTMNGWSLTGVPLATITAGGRSTQVRAGAVATVLGHVARRFHAEVEPLVTFHGWRSVATNAAVGGHPRSNHPSGTAFDANGYRHPYRAPVNFTAAQVAAIRRILAEVAPVVRWGGDFGAALRDGMHFEIVGTATQVATVAARLTTHPTIAQEDDMPLNAADLDAIQKRVNAALVSDIIRGGEFNAAVRAQASVAVTALIPTIAAAMDATIDDEALLALLREQQARNTTLLVPALTAAVIAALPPAGPGGVDPATIQAAAETAIRRVLGSLD